MTRMIHRVVAFGVLCLSVLSIAPYAAAQSPPWRDDLSHLTMRPPDGWTPMTDAALARANAGVSHVSGRGFIGGYSLTPANALIFPYMLIQFVDYDDREQLEAPKHKLGDRALLTLLRQMTLAFKTDSTLPESIDIETFKQEFASERARLVDLSSDGRFAIAGVIPFEDESGVIDYHTFGVIGKEGVGLVTIFGTERFDELRPIIEGPMRSLAFDAGYTYSDLPDAPPPAPDPPDPGTQDPETPVTDPTTPATPPSTDASGKNKIFDMGEAETTPAPAPPAPTNSSSTALIIIGGLVIVLAVVVVVIVLVNKQKAEAKRERARARRERLEHMHQ